jgi:hypothetical protein
MILRELYASLKSTNLSQEAILGPVRAKKEDLMKEVYTIMTATLGVPPSPNKKFVFDYYDKEGKAGRWEGTPIEFYKVNMPDRILYSRISWTWATRTSPPESTLPRNHFPSSMTQGMNTANFSPSINSEMSGVDDLSFVCSFISQPHANGSD